MSAPAKHLCFSNRQVYLMRVVSQPRYGDIDTVVTSINEGMEPLTRCGSLCITVRVRGPTQQPQS